MLICVFITLHLLSLNYIPQISVVADIQITDPGNIQGFQEQAGHCHIYMNTVFKRTLFEGDNLFYAGEPHTEGKNCDKRKHY